MDHIPEYAAIGGASASYDDDPCSWCGWAASGVFGCVITGLIYAWFAGSFQ